MKFKIISRFSDISPRVVYDVYREYGNGWFLSKWKWLDVFLSFKDAEDYVEKAKKESDKVGKEWYYE